MGEPKEKAPTLQTTPAGSLCAVPDRIPRPRIATVRLGVQIPASVRLLTRRGSTNSPQAVTKTLAEYLNCGILAHGAARVYCVWNSKKGSIEFHLLEVQYAYGYTGLTQVEPEMAKNVGDFRVGLEERLRSEAAEATRRREARVKRRLFEKIFDVPPKDPGTGSAAE